MFNLFSLASLTWCISVLMLNLSLLKQPQSQEIPLAVVGEHHHESVKCIQGNVNGTTGTINEVDIDESLLKVESKVASGSHGDL